MAVVQHVLPEGLGACVGAHGGHLACVLREPILALYDLFIADLC